MLWGVPCSVVWLSRVIVETGPDLENKALLEEPYKGVGIRPVQTVLARALLLPRKAVVTVEWQGV